MDYKKFELLLEKKISAIASSIDPAHDLLHFKRVVRTAKQLCSEEDAEIAVVMPAAWLHDFVIIAKDDPRRSQASRMSANEAIVFLRSIEYPIEHLGGIHHAIEAHSFSANIEAKTLEAKIVQDADRLDGLGAIGLARCFATAGLLKRPFYFESDPFCESREPNDLLYTIDHFYKKLFKTVETLQTKSGRAEGERRASLMKRYLSDLSHEI